MIDKTVFIKKEVYDRIIASLIGKAYEQGGIVGCVENNVISDFIFDSASTSKSVSSYIPDTSFLNEMMLLHWDKKGTRFCGFIHTHFINKELSEEDIKYARDVLSNFDELKNILMGIITLNHSAEFAGVHWYLVNDIEIHSVEVGIL